MFLLLCLTLLLSPCLGGRPKDVYYTLVDKPQASTMVQLLKNNGLIGKLGITSKNYTILCPTDAAFSKAPPAILQALLTDDNALSAVLLSHVVSGIVPSSALTDELTADTLNLQGSSIRFNIYKNNNVVTVNGANISTVDIRASNGIIHFIDDVILPVQKTMVELISADPELSTLLTAVTAAGIAAEFQADPLTLFAPTNAAFAALDPADLNKLLGDKNRLKETLEYHVISDTDFAIGLYNREYVKTSDSQQDNIRITISGSNGVQVNNGKVVTADIQATNGVIHKIDHVLIPRSVGEWLKVPSVGRK